MNDNEGLRILIIDDDEVDRLTLRRYLLNTPFEVEIFEAGNTSNAVNFLKKHTFNCVFLDYRLPNIDGITLVKQFRLEGHYFPIIVLTGQGDERTAVELMKAGASDYLAKSRLSPDILSSLIRNAMSVYRFEQRIRAAQQQLRQTNLLLRQQNHELEDQRQQIEQQNFQLLDANRHKTEFLATVTHELRTPLNSIMGFSQILKNQSRGELNSSQLEMIDRIFTNGQSLLNLVDDILDMSTIESSHLDLSPSYFNLGDLITEVTSELQLFADKKGLVVHLLIELANSTVYNDRQRLKQILTNLVSNALKFTNEGCVRVEVRSHAKNGIEILVIDTGIGIPKEQLQLIFQPFRQGNQTIKRRHSGTGLGLAITYSLVRMMEGIIEVSSEVNQGSIFRVQIPRRVLAPGAVDYCD
jgi:signal transduction histidine kinase